MQSASEFFQKYAEGPVELIGQGMEGAVYDLGADLVGKTWFHRSAADLRPLQLFLDELAAQKLPFRTPEISTVDEVDGRAVSIEVKLHGRPLSAAVEAGVVDQDRGFDIFVEVVAALTATRAAQATMALPAIGEPHPFRSGQLSWGDAVADLVLRRAAQARDHLEREVEGFGKLLEQLIRTLRELELNSPRIVHGDICTPNVLVSDQGETMAMLDWGFLTAAGDSTFDAGTAAGFYDMYGPDARAIDDLLLDRFENELGHSRQRMLLYRAAYAIITATIYSADASDGHFKWCIGNLNRPDVRATLS